MKRAKIMLSAIAVLAVVGGALAFTAKTQANVFCKFPGQTPLCQKVLYATNVSGINTTTDPCPNEGVFYTENKCKTQFDEATITVTSVIE